MDILTTLPEDSIVSAAFAELLEDVTNLLRAAQLAKPQDKEEVSFWRRQLNALNKAESYWLQGVRPQIGANAYLLASASRPGALVHRLTKQGGIVVCSCEAGQRSLLCWHHMLVNVIERAAELESLAARTEEEEIGGSGPEHAPEAAAALLSERLEATAQILNAMRAAQGRGRVLAFAPPDIPDEPQPPTEGDPEDPGEWRAPWYTRLATARRVYLEAA